MKKLYFLIISFLVIQTSSFAQFNDYSVKFGVQFNGLLPDTEFDKDLKPTDADFKFSYLARGYVRFEFFTPVIETEVGAGFGRLAGVDFSKNNWWTYVIPLDLRFILSPFTMDIWNPYAYGGVGALNYNNDKQPLNKPANSDQKGWTTMFPVGGGVEIALSDALLLNISGGYTFTLTDALNGYDNRKINSDFSRDGYYNLGLGLIFVNGSDASDDDKDGLIKRDEKEIGTDPNNPDSDKDGLKDGEEVTVYYTNPLKSDSDADGLKDGEEVFKYKTNPNKMDSDNDKLSDGDEVLKYNTDPLKADTDGDGLSDGEEVLNTNTDPNNPDSDNDGLSDGDEVKIYKTNPLNPDSDGDHLTDAEEVNRYKTDPLNPDTDGGTVDDYTEVNRGTNPLDPEDDVVKINVPIVLEGITFETGKADITPESEKILEGALKTLQTYPDIIVEISGHTDDVGSNASNQKLSQRRADSVRAWLISKGVSPDRLIAKGYGEEYPRVPNTSPENRRMNRRIEFKRIK